MSVITAASIAIISATVTLFVITVAVAIVAVWMQERTRRQWSRPGKCGQGACRHGGLTAQEMAEPSLGIFKGGR